ncbi:MAG TPA: PCRF domain-containing protein, partial [Methylibium sp.]
MKATLRQQFDRLAVRLQELDAALAEPDVASDIKRYRSLTREHAELDGLVGRYRRYQQREVDLQAARELLADPDMAELARDE